MYYSPVVALTTANWEMSRSAYSEIRKETECFIKLLWETGAEKKGFNMCNLPITDTVLTVYASQSLPVNKTFQVIWEVSVVVIILLVWTKAELRLIKSVACLRSHHRPWRGWPLQVLNLGPSGYRMPSPTSWPHLLTSCWLPGDGEVASDVPD